MSADHRTSVVIPTFNCAHYLPDAIASALAQSVPVSEVIVVDDGSDDATPSVVERLGSQVRYVRQAHQGTGAARNRGASLATGDYLGFLDADDLWCVDKVERQVAFLHAHTACDAVFGHAEEFYSPDLPDDQRRRLEVRPDPRPFYSACTMLLARSTFALMGGFSTDWRVGEFVDWYLRATDGGLQVSMLPDVVLRRRVHSGHLGRPVGVTAIDYARIIRHSLERRRAAGPHVAPPASGRSR